MAKSNNQKAKILFLEHMLRETGENRTISMQEILDRLSEKGITAERKSVYDDMEALRVFGLDVKFRRGRPGGYYLAGDHSLKNLAEDVSVESSDQKETGDAVEAAAVPLFVRSASTGDKKMKLICLAERESEVKAFFGTTAEYTEQEDGTILVSAPYLADPQFYGWLTALGSSVKIAKPKRAGQAFREYLKSLAREYKGV
ncbi:MAG: WYL domain-containing protein [Clostridiales bacterium]|nr:WYL domain-containing protein [Candidatus Blautia equi]